jgi:hypothetical protein
MTHSLLLLTDVPLSEISEGSVSSEGSHDVYGGFVIG